MSDHPLDELDPQIHNNDHTGSTASSKRRAKLRAFLGIPKSKSKEVKSKASNQLLNPRPIVPQAVINLFPKNVPKPANKIDLPTRQERIEKTEQLVYCNYLFLQDSLANSVDHLSISQEPMLSQSELDWLEEMRKDPIEKEHLYSLVTRMVEAFVADSTKGAIEIAEIVALGPVLPKEPYRKLMLSLIKDFSDARILDVNLLKGLIELLQCVRFGILVSDDLIKILSILRFRLQGIHQQSTEHSYHLTLAVSKVLDVMADHKVRDLDRVLEHEPLSDILSGLKDSSDPYLMYQACYAFQALQYVPDGESALQAVLRHSTGVVDGLIKMAGIATLDLVPALEGLDKLHSAFTSTVKAGTLAYEGVTSLMESGRGVLNSLKEGLSTGQKRLWYPAIKTAYAFAQAGHLKDLKQLIFETPCHRDPLFQWGICHLLHEIAVDSVWADATRQQAVDLLSYLYDDDYNWGRDESVKAMMESMIARLRAASGQVISITAGVSIQNLEQDKGTSIHYPYPLTTRLPVPASSPILTKVHGIPSVEYDLQKLRLQRLSEIKLAVYIPPTAKANLQARDDDLFALIDKVQEFLASDRQVMLILGDSGAGKSTFNTHLESQLLQSYIRGGRIPLFINLPATDEPQHDMIEKQLRTYNFSEVQIQELKLYRELILICDGYDESQQIVNLHRTNSLNQPGNWNTKMIISCRSQYLGQDYQSRFAPTGSGHYIRPALDLFQEAVILPFSKAQIEGYVKQYVPLEPRSWSMQDYMDKLVVIPSLMDLVKNPFILSLALEALPLLIEGKQDLSAIRMTRVQLYDTFVVHWLDVNKRRLVNNTLSAVDRDVLEQLLDAGFVSMGIEYSINLASAIFEHQGGNPVIRYVQLKDKDTWRAKFFGPEPGIRLLRESSPLTRTGSLFRFLHRSMLEYFLSRAIFDPSSLGDITEFSLHPDTCPKVILSLDPYGPLFKQDLLAEQSVIMFLCERVTRFPSFEKQLLAVIEQSKTDPTVARAAANAMTILVRAGVQFNGADLRCIRIPGADISGGQFDLTQLQGADLTGVNLARSWLRQVDVGGAQMNGVQFGELPDLEAGGPIEICTYSPDGRMVAVGLVVGMNCGLIYVYNTTTWTRAQQFYDKNGSISCIAFSPNSQQLLIGVSGDILRLWDITLRLWDITSGRTLSVMDGHSDRITSVVFSPCGSQIASASKDHTVQLWNVETGETVFILDGHTDSVTVVAYTSDGRHLISGSKDGTIRVWDPEVGEVVASWNISSAGDSTFALSPDGLKIAISLRDKIHITSTVTGAPGPVLTVGAQAFCIVFSPNGQWIAATSRGRTIQLWDVSTGRHLSSLLGHTDDILGCTFSPNSSQIVSGDFDGYVRFWEVDNTLSILNSSRPCTPIKAVTYCPDGQHILSSGSGQNMQQWNSLTGARVPLPLQTDDEFSLFALSPNGEQIAAGRSDGAILLWSRQANVVERTLLGHTQSVSGLIYSSCGRWILSTQRNIARLWDLHDGEHCGGIEFSTPCMEDIFCLTFTPADLFVLGTSLGLVYLHDAQSEDPGTPVKKISMGLTICSIDCSPDGQELAIGTLQDTVYLWEFYSDKPGYHLRGHEYVNAVLSVAYSPCGKWILSGSHDRTVSIWNLQKVEVDSKSRVAVVVAGSDKISGVSWNPVVSNEFVTGCEDGSVRVWRMSSLDDSRDTSVQMLWGNNVGVLSAPGLTFKGAIGLSSIHQKLLVQRGAVHDSSSSDGIVSSDDLSRMIKI